MKAAYLRNIPGLTGQRLGELYAAIVHVTADPGAMADVTYYAAGGLRIEIHWTQNGFRQHYPATLTAKQVAAAGVEDDALFVRFASETLDAVRKLRNQLADAGSESEKKPNFTAQASAVDTLVGAIRAGLLPGNVATDPPPADTGKTEEP